MERSAATSAAAAAVDVVADDLIWASRLSAAVERAGGRATAARPHNLRATTAQLVIVDLNGRSYDGLEAVAAASQAGVTVIAVGQHEDLDLRKRAIAAGAQRVYSYNKMFSDGPQVIAGWLERGA